MSESVNSPVTSGISMIFEWLSLHERQTAVGATRPIFNFPTKSLDRMTCHATLLDAGNASHAPHTHPEEELILLREGTLEVFCNGKTQMMTAGSIFFAASNDLHGVKNPGPGRAVYYVLKWFTPKSV
jgi:mannose-6-phosphate isomerase-like protein (cupin superfamily)